MLRKNWKFASLHTGLVSTSFGGFGSIMYMYLSIAVLIGVHQFRQFWQYYIHVCCIYPLRSHQVKRNKPGWTVQKSDSQLCIFILAFRIWSQTPNLWKSCMKNENEKMKMKKCFAKKSLKKVHKKALSHKSTQKSAQKSTKKSTLVQEYSKKCSKKFSKKCSKNFLNSVFCPYHTKPSFRQI